jgi:diadenosine tetraphosphate (Ap4A) HIT family hydrolase
LLKLSYAFLDIQPLSRGHALVIPKEHAVKLHELSDETLSDLLPVVKKVSLALGVKDYNILQNNGMLPFSESLNLGRIAHQVIDHVHFHVRLPSILSYESDHSKA